jgi:RNA polymerase sigma-70 factor (ECF subfamily)
MTYQRAIDRKRYLTSRHFYTRGDLDESASQIVDPMLPGEAFGGDVLGQQALQRIFESLPEHQRKLIEFFFFEGYTFREIAAKRGERLENVRHNYYRALEKLRKHMMKFSTSNTK